MKSQISYTFRSSLRQLGPLEERMLDKLWARNGATVRELFEDDHKDLAYTTVMTTLDRLFRKGLLKRSKEGRSFRYRPRFSREELYREAAGQALRLLLDVSSASPLPLSLLVEILGERDMQLIDDLRELVERKRRLGSCSPISRRNNVQDEHHFFFLPSPQQLSTSKIAWC